MDAPTLLEDLEARDLVQSCTDRDGLAARLAQGPLSLYYGCDPTAPSLHVGNLIGLLVLRRFQEAGHRPIALVGGATGMIGDPSGRSEERNLLDADTLAANVIAITAQVGRIVDIDDTVAGAGRLVDNLDWTAGISFLDFLRDVGKHVTVNTMLARESVRQRLASEHGISYTEFSYMLLQAHDFLRLREEHGVELQIGGSDQLGNMIGGVDLIRRVRSESAWALAWPLLTAPDGTKLGKTTGARIWLDPELTSPYRFFQHWMSVDDRQVGEFLAKFTMLPMSEVHEVAAAHATEPGARHGQRRLAREVTALVHGAEEAASAEAASAILFGAPLEDATPAALRTVSAEVPTLVLACSELGTGLDLVETMSRDSLLATSKGEARRAVAQGGVYVNGRRAHEGETITTDDLLHGRWVVLRRGKKAYAVLETSA